MASATGRPNTASRYSRASSRASSARNRRRPRAGITPCSSGWSRGAAPRTAGPCSTTAAATPAWATEVNDRHRAAGRSTGRCRAGRKTAPRHRAPERALRRDAGGRAGARAVSGAREPGSGKRQTWTLLDVGSGSGDVARAAVAAAHRHGIALTPVGIDVNRTAARLARSGGLAAIVADGSGLPLGPRSVDVIVASQVLHHLPRAVAVRWIATFDRVARRAVVLADLRRSRVAMAGVWAASLCLAMSGVSRHDAVLSLKRGYTREEFSDMLRDADVQAAARYRPGARIVAAWSPGASAQ